MSTKKAASSKKKSTSHKSIKGRLDISRSGMGFVIVEGQETDILIKPNHFGKAFHGDTVLVEMTNESGRGKRAEGVVVEVAERKQTDFIGTLQLNNHVAFFIAASEKPIPDFYVPVEKLNGAVDGSRVVVRLTRWEKNDKKPQGEVLNILSAKNESDMAMKEILIAAGFPLSFEEAVLKEAAGLSDKITREEEKKRLSRYIDIYNRSL